MTDKTILVDGDVLCYQSSIRCEEAVNWDDWLWTVHAQDEVLKGTIDSRIDDIKASMEASHMVFALTDSVNWRNAVYPQYKGHRKEAKTRKPIGLPVLRDHLLEKYDTYLKPTLEGDDVLGILATHPKLYPGTQKIIWSIDKDFKTVPGTFYDCGRDEWHEISEEEANYWHFIQTLMGDPTDGYPGIPGVGIKTAEKILSKACDWPTVVAAYKKKGLGEQVALTMARVARICQHTDYDFEKQEVILWDP